MGGGLIQLIAIGEQDKYITGKPEITFFKSVYKRHSNFAIEPKEQIFSGGVNFGQLNSCTVSKDGDLISGMILNINLGSLNEDSNNTSNNICIKDIDLNCYCNNCLKKSEGTVFSWVNGIGHAIVEYIEIEIGGHVIDKQYGEWFDIWTELTQNFEKKSAYYELIGKKDPGGYSVKSFQDSMQLLIPLNFWFCKNIGLSIPCIAITNHEIKVNIKWRKFEQLWISNNATDKPKIPDFKASLLIDYIYLDLSERKKFAKDSHFYLIEQTQANGDYYFHKNNKNPSIQLNFYHPVKEIIWAMQRADVLIRSNDDDEDFSYGNDWFNFSNSKNFTSSGVEDVFDTALIQINGSDRFNPLPAKYFRLLQPYKHHTKCPNNFVYVYSFALKPEEHQPTGTCNFSNFDNSRLILNMKQKNILSDYIIKTYAVSYNLLVVTKGMIGLGFSC